MKRYTKEINGKTVIKTRQQIIISKNGMSTYNPTEEIILEDGWVEYIAPVYEETLEDVRTNVLSRLEDYDKSEDVNEFRIDGKRIWFDKSTRLGLMMRLDAELENGKMKTSLWYNGEEFSLDINMAKEMLYNVEVYASECYDTTQKHVLNIKSLETKDELENYDFRSNYPEKLNFHSK